MPEGDTLYRVARTLQKALAGKTVGYIPVAMGFDLTQGWLDGLKAQLEPQGVKVVLRDPNWNTNAGAQAFTALIGEKPAVIVIHNPDVQTYAKLIKKAEDEGIYVVQINMRSAQPSTAFVKRLHAGNLALHLVFHQRVHLVQEAGLIADALAKHQTHRALHIVALLDTRRLSLGADGPGGGGLQSCGPQNHAQICPDGRVLVREHDHLQAVVGHVVCQVLVYLHH